MPSVAVSEQPAPGPLPPSDSASVTAPESPASPLPPKTDIAVIGYEPTKDKEPLVPIYLGDKSFQVTIADSQAEQIKGLSGSPQLPAGEGKLFIFNKPEKHGIWMKDMLFAIDIIWLNEAGKVIHIAPNIAPESYPEVFRPPEVARFVLEVPSGTVAAANLSPGDQLLIDQRYLP